MVILATEETLSLFSNLITLTPFDGRKVFVWSKAVWVSIVAIAIIFLFVLYYLDF